VGAAWRRTARMSTERMTHRVASSWSMQRLTTGPNPPRIGYASYTMTRPPPERIISLMKKLVDDVMDWLWDRLTYVVMSQGR
jgi:hypothetical protein